MKPAVIPARLRIVSGGPFEKPVFPVPFRFREPSDPDAAKLRKAHRLTSVAGEGTDFERARRLKRWVRSRWNHGYCDEGLQDDRREDALDILARARRGEEFSCWFYRRTLVQCCLAVGLPAREVVIVRGTADFPDRPATTSSHAVSEVYCRELGKWVMLDADTNSFYTIRGVPAGALEIQRAWHEDRGRAVRQVLDRPRFVRPTASPFWDTQTLGRIFEDFTRHRVVDFFDCVLTHTLNGFPDPPAKIGQKLLCFVGVRPPLLLMDYHGNDLDRFRFVESEPHFNWPLQGTYLSAAMEAGAPSNRIELRLEHTMPFFGRFELSVGDGGFRAVRGDRARFEVSAGSTRVRARCVDVFGRPGHEAAVTIEMKPATPGLLARRARKASRSAERE